MAAEPLPPLVAAVRAGDLAGVGALLAAGADPNGVHGVMSVSVLMEAEAGDHRAIAEALVAAGARTEGIDVYRLALAVERDDAVGLAGGLAAGADPNGVAPNQVSPVLVACRLGHLARLEQLLAAGARPSTQAVEAACLMGRREIVARLLEHGVRSSGRKSRDKDHLAIAKARARKAGWDDLVPRLVALQRQLA